MKCQKLILDRTALKFEWDIALYRDSWARKQGTARPSTAGQGINEDSDLDHQDQEEGAQSESDSDSDEEEGFNVDCHPGQFVLVVPDEVTDDTPFNLGVVKSNEEKDRNGFDYRWILWYERKHVAGTDAYTDTYVATKVKARPGDLRAVNRNGWQQVYSSSIAAIVPVASKGKGNHYKKIASRGVPNAKEVAAQIKDMQVITEEEDRSDDTGEGLLEIPAI